MGEAWLAGGQSGIVAVSRPSSARPWCLGAALWLAAALVVQAQVQAPPQPLAGLLHHGIFRQLMRRGDTGGTVELAALPQGLGHWGLGATAGLKGELIQVDGRLLDSPGSDERGRVRAPQAGEQALLFAAMPVAGWREVALTEDLDAAGLERWLAVQRGADGRAADAPSCSAFAIDFRTCCGMW